MRARIRSQSIPEERQRDPCRDTPAQVGFARHVGIVEPDRHLPVAGQPDDPPAAVDAAFRYGPDAVLAPDQAPGKDVELYTFADPGCTAGWTIHLGVRHPYHGASVPSLLPGKNINRTPLLSSIFIQSNFVFTFHFHLIKYLFFFISIIHIFLSKKPSKNDHFGYKKSRKFLLEHMTHRRHHPIIYWITTRGCSVQVAAWRTSP